MSKEQLIETIKTDISSDLKIAKFFSKMKRISPVTYHHSITVASIAYDIGVVLGLKEKQLKDLIYAGLLHDIGKMEIPAELLTMTNVYTKEQYNLMKEHSVLGYNLTKGYPKKIRKAILEHHENFNGTGYPNRKYGSQISLYGKILKVADVADAMQSQRPYKEPYDLQTTCSYMSEDAGVIYDPKILQAFFTTVDFVPNESEF